MGESAYSNADSKDAAIYAADLRRIVNGWRITQHRRTKRADRAPVTPTYDDPVNDGLVRCAWVLVRAMTALPLTSGTTLPLATWSPCKNYRYTLRRTWLLGRPGITGAVDPRAIAWLMLNPSTADEATNDPTISRCIAFSQAWGFDELTIVNTYALRSTDPKGLWKVADPVGPENDAAILAACKRADLVVCAWGKNAKPDRVAQLRQLLAGQASKLHALKLNNDGSPVHPLYQKGSLRPQPFGLPEDTP